jgi:hypothetical protein
MRDISTRFWSKVQVGLADQCWPWMAYRMKRPNGAKAYGRLNIKGRITPAHQVAWGLANGGGLTTGFAPIPNGFCVMHSCDNPECCNPAHLALGTYKDNVADMWAKGRNRLARPRRTKITAEQAEMITAMRGVKSQGEIAAEYGISTALVSLIQRNRAWKRDPRAS